jgi:hypothetical protein
MAAHRSEPGIPWGSTRPWGVSGPVSWRYWMAGAPALTAKGHTIIRTTVGPYDVNQAVTRGLDRAPVPPGSVPFIQRFGSALNVHLHCHCVFLAGVYLDRTAVGLKPRLLAGAPPTDTDMAAVLQKSSRRGIRTLRRLG